MTDARKFAILMAATILSARRIQESMLSDEPDLAKHYFVDRAIHEGEVIMERIDKRWRTRVASQL